MTALRKPTTMILCQGCARYRTEAQMTAYNPDTRAYIRMDRCKECSVPGQVYQMSASRTGRARG